MNTTVDNNIDNNTANNAANNLYKYNKKPDASSSSSGFVVSSNYSNVDFTYICIKQQFFDVNMVYLNYYNLKKKKQIEIIYKSPSIFLEGIFLKTPEIPVSNITISRNDKIPKYLNKMENIEIKIQFNTQNHSQTQQYIEFINLLSSLDTYFISYLEKYKTEIENELVINYKDTRKLEELRYINIIKNRQSFNSIGSSNTITWEMTLKSYIDKRLITELIREKHEAQNIYKGVNNTGVTDIPIAIESKYSFTFNISNLYFSSYNLIPLVKTNTLTKIC